MFFGGWESEGLRVLDVAGEKDLNRLTGYVRAAHAGRETGPIHNPMPLGWGYE